MTRPLSKKLVFSDKSQYMKQPHHIVNDVHIAYRGCTERIARITGKSAELYRSHGREAKTSNPLASGNVSPVDHYMAYCELYEAAEPGAGMMLANRTHAELLERFSEHAVTDEPQPHLEIGIIDETADVQRWLCRLDLHTASRMELLEFERECDEALQAIHEAKGNARARIRDIELNRTRFV